MSFLFSFTCRLLGRYVGYTLASRQILGLNGRMMMIYVHELIMHYIGMEALKRRGGMIAARLMSITLLFFVVFLKK